MYNCYYKLMYKLLAILEMQLGWAFKVTMFIEILPLKN